MIYKFRKLKYVFISNSTLIISNKGDININTMELNLYYPDDHLLCFNNNLPIKIEHINVKQLTATIEYILTEINV